MKVRQTYYSGEDLVCIRYTYNKAGLIAEVKEIDRNSDLLKGEVTLPRVEVTGDFFFKIINSPIS